MQSSVGQHQMEAGEHYYEYVELPPQQKTERQDSVPSTQVHHYRTIKMS